MEYKLAKKLKDIGFPQKGKGKWYKIENKRYWYKMPGTTYKQELYDDFLAYIPTLSELIKACGERFSELKLSEERWIASGYKKVMDYPKSYIREIKEVFSISKSPIEALAKLYIKLNK